MVSGGHLPDKGSVVRGMPVQGGDVDELAPMVRGEDSLAKLALDLKHRRIESGLSIRDLAQRAHMSRTALSDAEQGRRPPSDAAVAAYIRGVGSDDAEVEHWLHRVRQLRANMATAVVPPLTGSSSVNIADAGTTAETTTLFGGAGASRPTTPGASLTSTAPVGIPAAGQFVTPIDPPPGPLPDPPRDVEAPAAMTSWPGAALPANRVMASASPSVGRKPLRLIRAHRGLVTAVVVLVGIAMTAGALSADRGEFESGSAPTTAAPAAAPTVSTDVIGRDAAEFAYPADGQSVVSPLVPRGTATIPAGQALWLLLKPAGDDTIYVTTDSEVAVDPSGFWDSNLHLGRGACDENRQYRLMLVTAPHGGVIEQEIPKRPLGQYSVRLKSVPEDTQIWKAINITLGDYAGDRTC